MSNPRRLTIKQRAILKNAPGRNADVERVLKGCIKTLNLAIDDYGDKLRSGKKEGLQRILKVALNMIRLKGVYEGLEQGFRLHEMSLEIEGDPTTRTLLRRIYKYKKGNVEVSDKSLCKFLDSEIQRLDGKKSQPGPPKEWKIKDSIFDPWHHAQSSAALRGRLSKYLSVKRSTAWSEDYALIRAWEDLASLRRQKQPSSPASLRPPGTAP